MNKKLSERPNILLVITEQQRGDCLGCGGDRVGDDEGFDRVEAGERVGVEGTDPAGADETNSHG